MSFLPLTRGAVPFLSRLGAAPRARLGRVFVAALGVGVGVWMWGWLSTDEKGDPIAAPSDEPSLEIENLRSFRVWGHDNLPLWEIGARHVVVAGDKSSTLATGLERGTLFRAGKPFLTLGAQRVKISNPGNDLEANGDVSASGPNGFSFQTSRALWHAQQQIVDCPRAVTAWLRGLYFQTPHLNYNWQNGVLTCPDAVEVRGEGIIMRGKNLEATLKTHQVKMSGGVQVIVAARALPRGLSRSTPSNSATISASPLPSPTSQNN